MPVKISLKILFLILIGSFAFAAGMAFLLNFFLSGPKLGAHYDFLLKRQQPPSASREILIIDTDEMVESSDIYNVLLTLTEMEAANMIMTGMISQSSSSIAITETEIRSRFTDEYGILSSNIRNLFEAIRMGSVSPVEAPDYVNRLVGLTEQGRDRLLTALIDRDEELLRAIKVFGKYQEIEKKPQLDKDGVPRRVQPVDQETFSEHPVYEALKSRFASSEIEFIDKRQILWLRDHDGEETDIPLDKNGNIITAWNREFRRINISLFREYEEANRSMRMALVRSDALGAFSQTLPERSPLILGDYSQILREDMLNNTSEEIRSAWIRSRADYFQSLYEFITGSAESVLVKGYEDVIADETSLSDVGIAALIQMRDELKESFSVMREEYEKLSAIHSALGNELVSSFCIMGYGAEAEYSALLANALLTGSHIKPIYDKYILLCSIASAFIVLLIVFSLRPRAVLIFGLLCSIAAAAGFSCVFIFLSYWIDPLISLISSLAGTFAVFFCKYAIIKHRERQFRIAYGAAISQKQLQDLIRMGKPKPCDVTVTNAAVIAIKDINLLNREDRETQENAGKAKKAFIALVKKIAFNNGAVIAGYEGDTIIVCFGTSLDKSGNPVSKACALVRELLANEKIPWRFGIDAGECAFFWSQDTGFSVNGRPAVRARMLASRNMRLQTRALVTGFVREKANLSVEKTDSLYDDREPIYEFLT